MGELIDLDEARRKKKLKEEHLKKFPAAAIKEDTRSRYQKIQDALRKYGSFKGKQRSKDKED